MNGRFDHIFRTVMAVLLAAGVLQLFTMNTRLARVEEQITGLSVQFDQRIASLVDRIGRIERGRR